MRGLLAAVLVLVAVAGGAAYMGLLGPLLGGGGDAQEARKAAGYYISDDETFAANTRNVHFRPYNNPALEFDLRLPHNWEAQDLTKSRILNFDQTIIDDVITLQSEMVGVYRASGMISIQTLKREISAQTWLKNHIFGNGFALQGEVREDGPRLAWAYYSSIRDQINYYTYITVRITGNIAVIARIDLPLPLKDFASFAQKKVLDSLRLSYPKEDPIEPQKTFSLVDALKFSYPVSWQPMSPDYKDMSRLSVQLQSKDPKGNILGFIRFLAVKRSADTDIMKEVESMKQHFADYMKIDVRRLVSSGKLEGMNPRFVFTRMETYEAAYQKEGIADPEVRLALLGDSSWYVFAYLISLTEEDDLTVWGHNTRSFDLILKSMR